MTRQAPMNPVTCPDSRILEDDVRRQDKILLMLTTCLQKSCLSFFLPHRWIRMLYDDMYIDKRDNNINQSSSSPCVAVYHVYALFCSSSSPRSFCQKSPDRHLDIPSNPHRTILNAPQPAIGSPTFSIILPAYQHIHVVLSRKRLMLRRITSTDNTVEMSKRTAECGDANQTVGLSRVKVDNIIDKSLSKQPHPLAQTPTNYNAPCPYINRYLNSVDIHNAVFFSLQLLTAIRYYFTILCPSQSIYPYRV